MDASATPMVGATPSHDALDLLVTLAAERSSGVVRVGLTSPAWMALADGRVVVAGTSDGPGIAHACFSAGLIDESALARYSTRGGSHDLSVIEELTQSHDVDALAGVVRAQAVRAVFQMLLPPREESSFRPGPPIALAKCFSFPLDEIIDEARERVREWAEIAESIPSVQAVFRPRRRLAPELETISLSRDEWAVLAVLDGRRSVAQAIAAAGRSAYDVCAMLHRLIQAGLVERIS